LEQFTRLVPVDAASHRRWSLTAAAIPLAPPRSVPDRSEQGAAAPAGRVCVSAQIAVRHGLVDPSYEFLDRVEYMVDGDREGLGGRQYGPCHQQPPELRVRVLLAVLAAEPERGIDDLSVALFQRTVPRLVGPFVA
jgi:hypothetical protein